MTVRDARDNVCPLGLYTKSQLGSPEAGGEQLQLSPTLFPLQVFCDGFVNLLGGARHYVVWQVEFDGFLPRSRYDLD